ncbi:MAG TPA: NAD(P)-dependent oxidoreductase [Hyphomicrobiaceae bacterium]|nr:NAD(P)-dependent oxidoreductase [Hyphomicrobiaceae bacterium]
MAIGFVGIGNMGLPMAEKLIDGGHALIIHDLHAERLAPLTARQARPAASPREVGDQCEIAIASLPTLPSLEAVCLGESGLIHGKAVRIVVNTCTVGIALVEKIATGLAAKGITLVDCPISGGPPGARDGILSVMLSGDPAAVAKVRPIVSLWGKQVTVAGDKPGAAQLLKLTNNILSGVALVASAEAFVMGAKGGLDPEVMLAAINAGSGRNSATLHKFPISLMDRSFAFGATMDTILKDVELAIAQGEALGVPMWVSQAARLIFKHAVFKGAGQDDLTTIVRHVEAAAGFEIPKTR